MKVVYFIAGGSINGSNIALLNFLLILHKEGIVEPVVIMNKGGDLCAVLRENHIEFHVVKYLYSVYPKLLSPIGFPTFVLKLVYIVGINFFALRRLIKLVKPLNADIIHTNISILQIGFRLSKKLSIPHIWHIREYMDLFFDFTPMLSWRTYRNELDDANNYSVYITKDLQRHYLQSKRSFVIEDGVKSKYFKSLRVEKQDIFIFVGRLEEGKGIADVIETFCLFAQTNKKYKLVIIGNGEHGYVNRLTQIVISNGLESRVEFKGFEKNVDPHISQARALIMASKYEGLGFTTIEAMFNNTLVIGRNSGGTKAILENNRYGIVYNTNDELLHIMNDVASNNYVIDLEKSNLHVRNVYSIENNVSKIKELYYKVCKRSID